MGYDNERLLGPASVEEPAPQMEPAPLQNVAGVPQVLPAPKPTTFSCKPLLTNSLDSKGTGALGRFCVVSEGH